jgi:RNA polymerase sigma factor (sigma-70 family)
MTDLARRLRRLVTINDTESDADLLGRFVTDRDGLAFAALVSRHGPMVLAVCRRVLRHRQDAEDAFQATFLVLARRAGAVKPRSLLGNWLYGVAYRTALGARRVASARRAREARAAAMRTGEVVPDDGLAPELREALDRELSALPDVYRAAVVACELEGLTRREAAVRLGWTEGTLSSRLARARSLLAQRLSRYGLAVPVAGLGAVAGPVAVAGELAEPTVRLGMLVAAGEAVVAAPVAALMEGTMRTMVMTKFKALVAAVVVGCAVAVTAVAGWRADAAGAADSPKSTAVPKTADTPKRAANPDKERIAELERERERLLKQVADLQDRLRDVEAQAARADYAAKIAAANAARLAEQNRARLPGIEPTTPANPDPPPGETPTAPPKPPALTPNTPLPGPVTPKETNRYKPTPSPALPETAAKAVVRVYPVGDLAGNEKEGEALAKVLRAAVEPKSWGADAGVEYLPGRKVLVVRQTAKAHDEVAELLRMLQTQSAPGKLPSPGKP